MADYTEQERAQLQQQVMEEMRLYGQLHHSTADAVRDAQVGVKGFSKQVRDSTTEIRNSYKKLIESVADGAQGASVFNDALVSSADQVAAFGKLFGGPVVKGLMIGLQMLARLFARSNKQADALYDANARLARAGANSAKGLEGLEAESAALKYTVLGTKEGLDDFVKLISENVETLAMFGGSAFKGREQLVEVGKAFDNQRDKMLAMGFSYDEQNKGIMSYIKLQSQLGAAQKKDYESLAKGVGKYLTETQALAELTGMTREQQEQERIQARADQKFRAKLDQLRADGMVEQAEQLEAANLMLVGMNKPEYARAYRAAITNTFESADAQKLLFTTSGDIVDANEQLAKGTINASQYIERMAGSAGATNESLRGVAMITDSLKDTAMGYSETADLSIRAGKGFAKEYNDAMEEVKKMKEDPTALMKSQIATRKAQRNAALSFQEFVDNFMETAGKLTDKFFSVLETVSSWAVSVVAAFNDVIDYIKYSILGIKKPAAAATAPPRPAPAGRGGGAELAAWNAKYGSTHNADGTPKQAIPAGATAGTPLGGDRMQNYLKSIALTESGGNRNAAPKTSSARGLFQFTEDTWKNTVKQMGKDWSMQDRMDPTKSAEAAAFFTRQNASVFKKKFGREPSNEELYLMHFLGSEGAMKFIDTLQKDPGISAATVVGFKAFSANKDLFLDKANNRNRSVAEVYQLLSGRLGQGMMGATTGVYQGRGVSEDVANIPQLARGGITTGPDSGYLANLHGREAVVPLPNGDSIPVAFNAETLLKSLTDALRNVGNNTGDGAVALINSFNDMVRLQREQNDILGKMLQHQRA